MHERARRNYWVRYPSMRASFSYLCKWDCLCKRTSCLHFRPVLVHPGSGQTQKQAAMWAFFSRRQLKEAWQKNLSHSIGLLRSPCTLLQWSFKLQLSLNSLSQGSHLNLPWGAGDGGGAGLLRLRLGSSFTLAWTVMDSKRTGVNQIFLFFWNQHQMSISSGASLSEY